VLHVSTESILTKMGQSKAIEENQRVRLQDVIGPYCRSKLLAERYALQAAASGGPVVVVNPTLPIGPGDFCPSPPTQMIPDFCRGRRREYIDAELNLVDVRDVAEGMIRAMDSGGPGRRYLLANANLSIRTIFAELSRTTGVPEPHRVIPYGIALAAAYVSEF